MMGQSYNKEHNTKQLSILNDSLPNPLPLDIREEELYDF